MTLYTIGYENADITDLVEALVRARIQHVADVRKNPISHKRGFSKNKLAAHLSEANIQYSHFKGLGVPTEWRKRAKQHLLTREKMFRDYDEKILPLQADDIEQIRKIIRTERVALLCYETDASDCHRRKVSRRIRKLEGNKLTVKDLKPRIPRR